MTRTRKLYQWVIENPRATISFRDFERLLNAFGFQLDRTIGSHRQYIHVKVPRSLPGQPEGKDAKRYQLKLAMVDSYGLDIEDD